MLNLSIITARIENINRIRTLNPSDGKQKWRKEKESTENRKCFQVIAVLYSKIIITITTNGLT